VNTTNETGSGAGPGAPEAWCDAGGGTWVDLGNVGAIITNSILPHPPSGGNGLVDCTNWPNFQVSLNIGTDLINTAQWGTCAIKWLFIPNNFTGANSMISELSNKVPISYVTDAVGAATTLASAVNTSTTVGECSAPSFAPFSTSKGYLHTFASFEIALPVPGDVCGVSTPSYDTNVGEVFGYRSWFRLIIALAIWSSTVLILWRMMPWSRPGDGVEVVTAIGRADGYTLYSDHTVRKDDE
jgi:hypothetical protein